jgi:hypothetical protein
LPASPAAPHSTMHDASRSDRNALIVITEMRSAVKADDRLRPRSGPSLAVRADHEARVWLRDILRKRDGLCG